MKGILNDRFLLAALSLLLLAVLAFGYFLMEDQGTDFALGQTLTEQQKAKAIDIAMSDPLVMQEVGSMLNLVPGTYHVKGVLSPSPFHEIGPQINRYRSLPAVEIDIGNESQMGTNILAFVDLSRSRVAYIAYAKRADMNGQVPPENRTNISIAETGYRAGQILTGEQREKAIKIALDNVTVQEKMMGKNYSVKSVAITNVGLRNGDDYYVGAYPLIEFTEGTPIYEPDFLIDVAVDVDQGKVLEIMVLIRTPVLRDTAMK